MRILLLNGSPRGERSGSFKISNAFLRGVEREGDIVKVVHLKDCKIAHCVGCYSCWTRTPGKCVQKDDAVWLLDEYVNADLVIWSSPLYSFGLTSIAKTFLDRLLPVYQPLIEERNGDKGAMHPFRFDFSYQRYVLVTGCGFYSYENNMEALVKQFEIMYGDKLSKIICTECELFQYRQLEYRTGKYLDEIRAAGLEYRKNGHISDATQKKLEINHYVPDEYMKLKLKRKT